MEKRGLISLRGVLLRYLVQTVFCCVLALLVTSAAALSVEDARALLDDLPGALAAG